MTGIIRTILILRVNWLQAAFMVFTFFIKFIFFHKYENKEELDNCIFESNVFNNNRFSLLITLDSCIFFMLSVSVHIRPEMKTKSLFITVILLVYQQNWKQVEVRIWWDKTQQISIENILEWALFWSSYLKVMLQHYQEARTVW